MSSNLTWSGVATDVILFDNQNLTVGFSADSDDPIGTVTIKGTGSDVLSLPNSTQSDPTWEDIPGTSPELEARQDGHFPVTDILIRYKDGQPLAQTGSIAESAAVVVNRATLVDPGTAADQWQFQYNGNRVTYTNEFACLRVRGIPDFQVPARFMSNAARDGSPTLSIMQASLSDATSHLFQVMGDGDIQGPGGASMTASAPTAVTFNAVAGTANATLISDGSATGAPYAVTTTLEEADNRVYLDGAVANPTGVSISGGTVLFTVLNAHRPTAWTQRIGRTSTALQTRVTIKPNGECVLDQPLAAGATISFDGMNWRKA